MKRQHHSYSIKIEAYYLGFGTVVETSAGPLKDQVNHGIWSPGNHCASKTLYAIVYDKGGESYTWPSFIKN